MSFKSLLAAGVSATLLALVYLTIDLNHLIETLAHTDLVRLLVSLAVLLALVGLSAIRLAWLARAAGVNIGYTGALRATLAANALNLFVPGKLGDLAKASMLREAGQDSIVAGLNISIYEKLGDVVAVLLCGMAALILIRHGSELELTVIAGAGCLLLWALLSPTPARLGLYFVTILPERLAAPLRRLASDWIAMLDTFRRRPGILLATLALTLAIWAGHFLQIALMAWALGVTGPWIRLIALFPVLILSGLIPITIAGIGPRDAAMVVLAGPLIGEGTAAALGVLFLLRYLVPGVIGLPVMPEFSRSLRRAL